MSNIKEQLEKDLEILEIREAILKSIKGPLNPELDKYIQDQINQVSKHKDLTKTFLDNLR